MATEIVQILDFFPFKKNVDTPAFKVLVFASDIEFGIEMNIISIDIPTQNFWSP